MNRKLQVKRTISVAPSPEVRSASTVQRASGVDHDARVRLYRLRPEPLAEVQLFAPGAFHKDRQRAITAGRLSINPLWTRLASS